VSVSPLSSSQESIRFCDFEVDPRSGELRKHGIRIKLQVQPFQVLQILLECPGEVVNREELQKKIWPANTFVDFDQGLNNAVKKLREALGDDAEKPRFIETLSRRGYRFIGSVQNGAPRAVGKSDSKPASTETRLHETHRKGFGWGLALGAAAVAVLILAVSFNTAGVRDHLLGKAPAPRIESLAVLPLQNLSGDPNQEYFSDGMTDALITDLAQISSLKVISRTSSTQYKQTKKSLPEVARELKVDGIIEGTVQRSGDRVRITAQLIYGPSDKHLWANSYERDMRDVFTLERELAGDVGRQVEAHVMTGNQVRMEQSRPVNPKTLDAYLQGSAHLNRFGNGFGDGELRLASDYFRQAIEADPNFAPAYAQMSKAYRSTFRSSNEDTEMARKSAEKAVELDPTLSDAWMSLAGVRCDSWDWQGTEEAFRRAIALNPSSADAHEYFSYFLYDFRRNDEGWKESQIAQQLDPNQDHMVFGLLKLHEYDHGIELALNMLSTEPNYGPLHYALYKMYTAKAMHKEAIQQLQEDWTLIGSPGTADEFRHAFTASGYMGAMREVAKEMEHLHAIGQIFIPVDLAEVYATLGNKARAFYWLEQGYKHRGNHITTTDLMDITTEPGLDPLRTDPRFKDLIRRLGLPQ
jgi:TolB-like protein/DNA-binding winged helix-turn-helix (wHTH) protein/tetratricopeptide (TPR) repeat protein